MKKKIYFSYVVQKNFSGQSRATEQIIEYLSNDNFDKIILNQYSYNRKRNKILSLIAWIFNTLSICPKLVMLFFDKKPIIHLSLGQEWASIIRVIWWYFPVLAFKRVKIIISLNGRNFQSWNEKDFIKKIFKWIILKSDKVTVVGPNQKLYLIENFNISDSKIEVIPNTSDFSALSENKIMDKYKNLNQIQIMFLSLLIESKGFKLYLDALLFLVKYKEIKFSVKAFICGTISFSKYCKYFNNSEILVTNYINNIIEEIKTESKKKNIDFQLKWINGIRGEEKQTIFKDTNLFVLPTFFPTESQPLVLLEAMSSGCAVITTKVGEIEYLVGDNNIFIEEQNVEILAEKIYNLMNDIDSMEKMALNNFKRYEENFSKESYTDKWNKLIKSMI